MKKYLALLICVCMVLSTFAAMTVSAATENRDIAPECIVEAATDGYGDNDAANMFDGKLDTYYMAGKVTDADGVELNTSSSNTVWIKLAEHEKITRIETTFGTKTERKELFGNNGNQNQNFFMFLTDFGPDEANYDDNEGIIPSEGKTATRITNGFSNQAGNRNMNEDVSEETKYTYLAIYGPFSSGLCISDLKIFADAEEREGLPPGVITQLVEKQITPLTAGFTSNDISNDANVATNIIDGKDTSMAIVDGFGRGLYIDLGNTYQITKIEVTYPTTEAITAFVTETGIGDAEVAKTNRGIYVRIGENNNGLTGDYCADWGIRINSGASVSAGTTTYQYKYDADAYTYDKTVGLKDMGQYRYIAFVPNSGSTPAAVAEVKVYGLVEEIVDTSNKKNINVAEEKLVYSNANDAVVSGYPKSMTYEMNAVDRKASTIFAGTTYAINSDDTEINFETVIDLGNPYKITDVKYIPYGDETTSIYGSNSYRFDDLEAIATNVATVDGVVQEYTVTNKSYRYIVVDRISAEAGTLLGIRDIEVYANVREDDVEAAISNTAGIQVGLNGKVYHTGKIRFGGVKENMNDGIYDHGNDAAETFVISATSGTSHYAVMDLGAAYNISAVALTQALGCSGFNNAGFTVVATNDEITDTTDLTTVAWTELASGYVYANDVSKYLLPITVDNEYSFRYVGIKGANYSGIPFREMDVYTSAMAYDFGTYTAYASGRAVSIEFTSDAAEGIDSAKILIASYDSNGALIKIVSETLDIDWSNGGSASDLYVDAIAPGATTKKVFIIDPASTLSPLANCITL